MLDRVTAAAFLIFFIAAPAPAEKGLDAPSVSPEAQRFLSPEAAASAQARAADSAVDRVEILRVELADLVTEVREAEERASRAGGTDAIALREQGDHRRIESLVKLGEFVAAVDELDPEGDRAIVYRGQLTALLPPLWSSLGQQLEQAEQDLAELRKEADSAAPEAQVAMQQRVVARSELVGNLLTGGVDLIEMMEGLGIDSSRPREQLEAQLADRASISSSRLQILDAQVSEGEAHLADAPDDAATQTGLRTARQQLETIAAALDADVTRMDQLGMETTEYKQLLITTTGEITSDVLDAEIMGGLLSRWAGDLKETVFARGPAFLFKALFFSLVVFVFWMTSRFVRRVTERAVEAPHLRFSQLLKRMIVSLSSGAVMVLGLLVALSQLGIEVGPLLAGLGIAGFIVGFALQETLANFAAGVMILAYRPFDVGDLIECSGSVFGTVSHMNLVSTTILTIDNQTKVVPNGKIWGDVITNVTAQKTRRVDLVFGISYGDDIAQAESVMWSVLKEHPKILRDPEAIVKLHELGDSSVNFVVRPWCARDDYWDVRWDVIREVKLRFDREGISIPFPQRDVHFYPARANGSGNAATLGEPTSGGRGDPSA